MRRGDGKGKFAEAAQPVFSVPPDPTIVAVSDLNNDGHPDVVLSHGRTNTLTVLLNDGKGAFDHSYAVPLEAARSAYAVFPGDINADKHMDLIVATVNDRAPFDSRIVVLLSDGRDGFVPASGSPFPAAPGAYTMAVGDINGDGKLDVAASSFESSALTILLGR